MASTAFRFDAQNEAWERIAERQAARLVTGVSEETRAALRALIVRSIREGIPVYDAARMIREMVGLTTKQAQAAASFRTELINSGLTPERVNTETDRYAARLLRRRAENIVRTEIMSSLNRGTLEAWRQARREGLLSRTAMKEVLVTPDDRLCFVAGTPVATPDGERPIEALRPGDQVWTHAGPRSGKTTMVRPTRGSVVAVVTAHGRAIATADHPYLVIRDDRPEWCMAGSLNQGDLLCGLQRPTQSRARAEGFHVRLDDPHDTPTVTCEPSVLPGIPRLVLVPVVAVGFQGDTTTPQQEINAVASNPSLLGESDMLPLELETDGAFQGGLPGVLPVARDRAESAPVCVAGENAELSFAVATPNEFRRAPTRLRAEAPEASLVGEALPAPWTGSVGGGLPSAFERAHGVSVRNDRWYLERLRADGTDLRDVSRATHVTRTRTEASALQVVSSGRPERAPATLADEVVRILPLRHESIVADESPQEVRSTAWVYSLEVEEAHTFFAAGVLVHNCPICAPLDGQTKPLNEPFQTSVGPKMNPPFHPSCRCTIAVSP